jgi:hypothetical protein
MFMKKRALILTLLLILLSFAILFFILTILTSCAVHDDEPENARDADVGHDDPDVPPPPDTQTESDNGDLTENEFAGMSGNPIFTSIFTADPSAHVWPYNPDKIYVYPSQDIFPSRGCDFMDRYHVFSSANMVDWIDEGEILRAADVPWGRPEGGFMWAPDAAYKNGTYYFYFPHPTGAGDAWNDTWKIGVAHSDRPASGFRDNEIVMLTYAGTGEPVGGHGFIDPAVFRDDDGVYYMIVGGGGRCYIGVLSDDMRSIAGSFTEITNQLPNYHEGPWLFKRGSFYYLMYPGKINPSDRGDSMLYAMSASVHGPWEYKGAILDPVSTGDTSHGSIVEFKNRWYLFYHTAELSNGNGTLRSTAVEEIFFNADGTIQKAVQTITGVRSAGERKPADTPGLELKYYDMLAENYEGYTERTVYWADSPNTEIYLADFHGGAVHNMHIHGAYIEFANIYGGRGGRALLTVNYASADNASAKVDTSVNQAHFLSLPATGGWGAFTGRASRLIDLNPGTDNFIRLTGGMGGFNIESVAVSLAP